MPGPIPSAELMMGTSGPSGIDLGVTIINSARFILGDSQSSAITMVDSDGTQWTISFWMKRGNLGSTAQTIFGAGPGTSNFSQLKLFGNGTIGFIQKVAAATVSDVITDAFFRDPTAWYHVVVNYDSDQAVDTDRLVIFINGVSMNLTHSNPIDSGRTVHINENALNALGRRPAGFDDNFFDGLLAEFNFIDGLTKVATEFGKFNPEGHWIPQSYGGAYGTNGFRLNFADNTNFGKDVSGNGNDLTDVNLTTDSQSVDTPTDNAATLNPVEPVSNLTLTEANLKAATSTAAYTSAYATQWANQGKWYWEITVDAIATEENIMMGWLEMPGDPDAQIGSDNYGWALQFQTADNTADVIHNGAVAATLTPAHDLIATDVIGMAIDIDAGKIWWSINGTYIDGGDPGAGTGANITDATITGFDGRVGVSVNTTGNNCHAAFDKDTIITAAPSGFKTFQTSSLSDDEFPIPTGSDHFDILLYTGDGVSEAVGGNPVTGLSFSPDIVWIKNRSATDEHGLADTVQGVTKHWNVDNFIARITDIEGLMTFDSGGFTVGSRVQFNTNTENYVAWCWKRGIVPGLDIIEYTGNGSAGKTIAHNLGAVPQIVIVKAQDAALWYSRVFVANYLDGSGNPITDPETDHIRLGFVGSVVDNPGSWNDVLPSSTIVTLGNASAVNQSGKVFTMYVFREIEGFSKFGYFNGKAALDGSFIWTGFRTKWWLQKRTDSSDNWWLQDVTRSGRGIEGNDNDEFFFVDVANSEGSGDARMDFLSNGVKLRRSWVGKRIFMAFAEHPFKYARAR